MKSFDELEKLNLRDAKIAVVWPSDQNSIKAVLKAKDKNGIQPILIGDFQVIKSLLDGVSSDNVVIQHVDSDIEAAQIAVKMARDGHVHGIMKGKIDTGKLLKEVVNKATGIRTGDLMSHLVIHEMASYHKLLAMTDGGMNLYPDIDQKESIIKNSIEAMVQMGIDKPKVALLAAVEKVNSKMPETVDAGILAKSFSKNKAGAIVEGPISYDLAMSAKSAEIKGYQSNISGDVDLLVVPNIQVGNILGKSLVYSAGAKMAGVVLGARVPIILTSRGSSFEEKYYSILLSGMIAM